MSTPESHSPSSPQTRVGMLPPPSRAANLAVQEFLAFRLGSEEYGIDILQVQEIRSFELPTRLANAPDFLLGVLNLREVIMPVVDMRIKFALGTPVYDACTVVIVLHVAGRTIGMVVDSVSDVMTLEAAQLRPVPELDDSIATSHLMAVGSVGDRMLLLVDIAQLMQSPEMGLFRTARAAAPAILH